MHGTPSMVTLLVDVTLTPTVSVAARKSGKPEAETIFLTLRVAETKLKENKKMHRIIRIKDATRSKLLLKLHFKFNTLPHDLIICRNPTMMFINIAILVCCLPVDVNCLC